MCYAHGRRDVRSSTFVRNSSQRFLSVLAAPFLAAKMVLIRSISLSIALTQVCGPYGDVRVHAMYPY